MRIQKRTLDGPERKEPKAEVRDGISLSGLGAFLQKGLPGLRRRVLPAECWKQGRGWMIARPAAARLILEERAREGIRVQEEQEKAAPQTRASDGNHSAS